MQTLCTAELGLWAQPVCMLNSGSKLLLLPRKNCSEVAGRKGCFPGTSLCLSSWCFTVITEQVGGFLDSGGPRSPSGKGSKPKQLQL